MPYLLSPRSLFQLNLSGSRPLVLEHSMMRTQSSGISMCTADMTDIALHWRQKQISPLELVYGRRVAWAASSSSTPLHPCIRIPDLTFRCDESPEPLEEDSGMITSRCNQREVDAENVSRPAHLCVGPMRRSSCRSRLPSHPCVSELLLSISTLSALALLQNLRKTTSRVAVWLLWRVL